MNFYFLGRQRDLGVWKADSNQMEGWYLVVQVILEVAIGKIEIKIL